MAIESASSLMRLIAVNWPLRSALFTAAVRENITLQEKLCNMELPTDLDARKDNGNDDLTAERNKERLGRKDDRLCGLVVRVSGYRYRGLGFDSRRYQIL